MGLPIRVIRTQFDPRRIADMRLCLDASIASSYTLDGSNRFSEWRSLVGGHVASQTTAGSRPASTSTLAGFPVPTFSGASGIQLKVPNHVDFETNSYTIFGVVDNDGPEGQFRAWIEKATSNSVPGRKWWVGNGSTTLIYTNNEVCVPATHDGSIDLVTGSARTDPVVVCVTVASGGSATLHVNGVLASTDTSFGNLANTSDINIGGSFYFWNGKIAFVGVYGRALGSGERQYVERGLSAQWKI